MTPGRFILSYLGGFWLILIIHFHLCKKNDAGNIRSPRTGWLSWFNKTDLQRVVDPSDYQTRKERNAVKIITQDFVASHSPAQTLGEAGSQNDCSVSEKGRLLLWQIKGLENQRQWIFSGFYFSCKQHKRKEAKESPLMRGDSGRVRKPACCFCMGIWFGGRPQASTFASIKQRVLGWGWMVSADADMDWIDLIEKNKNLNIYESKISEWSKNRGRAWQKEMKIHLTEFKIQHRTVRNQAFQKEEKELCPLSPDFLHCGLVLSSPASPFFSLSLSLSLPTFCFR